MDVNPEYINELRQKFSGVKFERLKSKDGIYVTSWENVSLYNDYRIFVETQIKRLLSNVFGAFISKSVVNKLSYFSQDEDKEGCSHKIYKLDVAKDLEPEEKYAIQNIGHATQLIQVGGINVLTDPIFNGIDCILYPEKTVSHPDIEDLPKVDVVLISHNHRDHLDKNSLSRLLECYTIHGWRQPLVFVPLGDGKLVESFGYVRVTEVDWFTKITLNDKVSFVSIPADHRSGRTGVDHHRSLVTGWVINPKSDVIVKCSGDTRPLADETQKAVDAVIWNEITNCSDIEISNFPEIICLEPSGPNYTQRDMSITHQSSSYSALLKFLEAKNLSDLSGKPALEFLKKIHTIMIHHNKFELGPDRFNEGVFVFKKLTTYLDLNEDLLRHELAKQKEKLDYDLDKERLRDVFPMTFNFFRAFMPRNTSLLVHAKDFIIEDLSHVVDELKGTGLEGHLTEYLLKNTIFPKIGERLTDEKLKNAFFDVNCVVKYNGKHR